MSPFLLKHTENFMLENEDMRSVEHLKNEQIVSPALAQKVPKKFIHEMESTPNEKQEEVNQAVSLGIVD